MFPLIRRNWAMLWDQAGVPPDAVTYNVAIKACQSGGQATLSAGMLEQGFALAAEMHAAGLAPDVITHTSLARLCAQAGDGQRALALHQARTLLKPSRDASHAHAVCSQQPAARSGHCRLEGGGQGCVSAAGGLLHDIPWSVGYAQGVKAAGLRVDKTYLTAVMSALGVGGLAQEALDVFHSMVRRPYCLVAAGRAVLLSWLQVPDLTGSDREVASCGSQANKKRVPVSNQGQGVT